MIRTEAKHFLEGLATRPRNAFERAFATLSLGLGLCQYLTKSELNLLYDAALLGRICCFALNNRRPGDSAEPDQELRRTNLELGFMSARDTLFNTPGWRALPLHEKAAIERSCLNVRVYDNNLQ